MGDVSPRGHACEVRLTDVGGSSWQRSAISLHGASGYTESFSGIRYIRLSWGGERDKVSLYPRRHGDVKYRGWSGNRGFGDG